MAKKLLELQESLFFQNLDRRLLFRLLILYVLYSFFFSVSFSFSNLQGSHRPWATRFVACELLSMLNLIAQVGLQIVGQFGTGQFSTKS